MSGPFLSPVSISAMRYEQEVFNSRLKRGEIEDADKIVRTTQVFCGCGHPQCGFISTRRSDDVARYAKQRADRDRYILNRDRERERARRAAEKAAQPVWY